MLKYISWMVSIDPLELKVFVLINLGLFLQAKDRSFSSTTELMNTNCRPNGHTCVFNTIKPYSTNHWLLKL